MPKEGAAVVTIPEWFAEDVDRYLKEQKDTRYQSRAEVLMAAYLFWLRHGTPEVTVKRRGRWIEDLLTGETERRASHGRGGSADAR